MIRCLIKLALLLTLLNLNMAAPGPRSSFDKDLNRAARGNMMRTNLDDHYRSFFLFLRDMSIRNDLDNHTKIRSINLKRGKLQPVFNGSFPCDLEYGGRSETPPTTVQRIKPGDIDVVASIGDSLSAGNGVMGATMFQILTENRGVTFAGGGEESWRTVLTLPNILKLYNSNLQGYATADSLTVNRASHLNIAEPMIMSRDLPYQALVLIRRMQSDRNIDMSRHWKLLTIFVGNNDICSDMCHHSNMTEFLKTHEINLRNTLTILRTNVPRLLVNLVPVPNLASTLLSMTNVPANCRMVHYLGCHCLFSPKVHARELKKAGEVISRWQRIDQVVASSPEFNTQDFAVIYQPLTTNVTLPTLSNGKTDWRFLAVDCFHFSQLGHASVANTLWNNMLQSSREKDTNFSPPFEKFLCPSREQPYIKLN